MNTFKPVVIPGTVINENNAQRYATVAAAEAVAVMLQKDEDELLYQIETDGKSYFIVAYEHDGYRVGAF